MKKYFKAYLTMKKCVPFLLLVVLLSSIAVVSFHNHNCSKESDNCSACRLQQSFSSLTIGPAIHEVILQKPLSDSIPILNERATDPSQKIVCFSHAPPQFC
jgi:hypothetical protein